MSNAVVSFGTEEPALHLAVPRRTGLADGFAASANNVTILVDGHAIGVDGPIELGETRTVPLPDEASEVQVVYSTVGTFRPTTASVQDRGLTLLTPLVIDEIEGLELRIEVTDPRVSNVGCVDGSTMVVCGEAVDSGWVVETVHGTDVLAQLDLD